METEKLLRKLEGLHTVETVQEELGIKRQSALNLLSKLKKLGYVQASKTRKKRFYKISMKKFRKRDPGIFDIINKHSPHMKLAPWYDHQVHGKYTVEDALIDAIQTQSFRAILASMRLFNHITDWSRLYNLAKKHDCWQKVGALYDVAKLYFRVRKMPESYVIIHHIHTTCLIKQYPTKEEKFMPIEKKWHVAIPFRKGDIRKVIAG